RSRGTAGGSRAVRRADRARAGADDLGVVVGEARVRSLPAPRLHDRADASRLAARGAAPARRAAGSARGQRDDAGSAASAAGAGACRAAARLRSRRAVTAIATMSNST